MPEKKIGLKNAGIINPESIGDYIAAGGYDGFKKALHMTSADVIAEIEKSGLRGRGGAGFPTGMKWKTAFNSTSYPKYVICNADEGEPGTFKDRIILEQDPHSCLEGVMLASYAISAHKAFIYVRGEYFLPEKMMRKAIADARDAGLLGDNILGSGYSLDVQIKLGAGSYLCGEEFCLVESLEGKRGYPRIKPPFPAEKGVFFQPTIVNNVETLSHIPHIIREGADWYRTMGTEKSPGTKIFTLCGDVNKPGAYEAEMGVPLKELIYTFAGGIANGKTIKTALVGGASGTFVPPSELDMQMDYDSLKSKGFTLGSGAVIVLGEGRSLPEFLFGILGFFQHESCGKCVPCRAGTTSLRNAMEDILAHPRRKIKNEKSLSEMEWLSTLMLKTSLCPLGQSPYFPITSAVKYFKNDFLGKE
ncbi:MAG: NADH-quinone oxidoreductase subunit NuoF [Planctomycetes bacterium]|nr:NADH-quinone oxidoreductase subunit NuoF [Planctomycetota bacterium]